jgi:hypothetical protein
MMKFSEQKKRFPWDAASDYALRSPMTTPDVVQSIHEHRRNWTDKRDWAADDMQAALNDWERVFAEVAKTGIISYTYFTQYRIRVFDLAIEHSLTDAQRQDLWRWMRVVSRAAMETLESMVS